MGAQTIRSLVPCLSAHEAARVFVSGLPGWLRRRSLGPLRSVADVYVPFRVYRVSVRDQSRSEVTVLGLDAVAGVLDLYRFDTVPAVDQLIAVKTRNRLEARLDEVAAQKILAAKVERLVFQRRGFFGIRRWPRVAMEPAVQDLHVPYWVGFFGPYEAPRIVVMDAVRRRIEGAKVRRLLRGWLST